MAMIDEAGNRSLIEPLPLQAESLRKVINALVNFPNVPCVLFARRRIQMKFARLLLRVILTFLVLLLSVALGAASFYSIAPFIDNLFLLAGLAMLVVALVGGLGVRWATGRRVASSITFVGWPLLLLLTLAATIHAPGTPLIPVPPMPDMQHWSLATGSRIA